ncbi:GRIP1-associated protein 1-like [Gigantopelta aegis]|uniref:GRIP1-associated protein 1-like n=1 Tax=Gigantopelta aegis TaxID=1735272 RepID=UPI001B889F52|nr:GRIP1-associated protein 1-like [Gigantopelta aegis]
MASSLSEEEFHRMQLQLIELRTANYEYEGKVKKLERELQTAAEKIESVDRELQKANKAIAKSKKAKDVELLIQETNALERKLQSQEEDFRLQNETLMAELSMLVANNEQLDKDLQCLRQENKAGVSEPREDNSRLEDEIRRLQAQNSVLQKNLAASQEKYEKGLNKTASDVTFPGEREAPTGGEDEGDAREVEGQDDDNDHPLPSCSQDDEVQTSDTKLATDYMDEISNLKLALDTELEEKKILKEQLSLNDKKTKEQINSLQEELEKVSEKLKKKQESYMTLQSEKESLFEESNKKIEELQQARDRDQKYYQDQISKLQAEVERLKKVDEDAQNTSDQHVKELGKQVSTLQQQIDASSIVGNQQLQEKTKQFDKKLSELQNTISGLSHENDDLKVQLRESQKASQETLDQLQAAQKERDTQIQALQEISKVAEKRKSLLDELAIKYQKDSDNHHKHWTELEEKHQKQLTSLQKKIDDLKFQSSEFDKHKHQCEELQVKVKSLEDAKSWLERRLKEVEDQLEEAKTKHESVVERMLSEHELSVGEMKQQHQAEIEELKQEHDDYVMKLEVQGESQKTELENQQMVITSLHQEVKDGHGEKKIAEKKGMSIVKDLKRQLHAERKRAEKLQERLQEVLIDSTDRQSVEDLLRPIDQNDPLRGDNSSVSSWGAGASGLSKDSVASGPQSPNHTLNYSFSSDVEHENNELLSRITELQQQKWKLEEQVNHLETSNGCMANDLLSKTAIIRHYVMGSKTECGPSTPIHEDKNSLNKILDIIKKGDDQELKEMNKKLQRMLEETLTKNMHLQQDLEIMSQELVRLSKLSHAESLKHKYDEDGVDITEAGDLTS